MTDVQARLVGTSKFASASGASPRQLDYWARTGVLEPVVPARGSGTRRKWAMADLDVARALSALSKAFVAGAGTGSAWRASAFVGPIRESLATGAAIEVMPGLTVDARALNEGAP